MQSQEDHNQDNNYGHQQGKTPPVPPPMPPARFDKPQAEVPTAPSPPLPPPPGRQSPPPLIPTSAACDEGYDDQCRSIQNHGIDNNSCPPPPPPPPPPPHHNVRFQTLPSSYSVAIGQPPTPLPWSSELFDCVEDISGCCLVFWCPCVAFGQIAEIVDRGTSSCIASGSLYLLLLWFLGCPCIYSCFYRSRMRGQFYLEESPCPDFCVHCLCEPCALCQEYRELKTRGFNMCIGWHENMDRRRQQQVEQVPPNIPVGMTR